MENADTTALADEIARDCIAVRMRMLNRVVTGIYDDALRPLGLKVSQMNILVAAAKLGTARPAEIGKRMRIDVSTLSRNVERMKARGWLEVITESDGRTQPFRLTAAGRKLLRQAAPIWRKAQQQARNLLGKGIDGQLNRALRRLNDSNA